jgi:hypothetical protein
MAFEKLSADEVGAFGSEYVSFLRALKPGEGARASVTAEGVTKITLKKRLVHAAELAGVKIKFQRATKDTVVLEVVGPAASRRRGK